MHPAVLIVGIIGVALLAFAILANDDEVALPSGILAMVFLISSLMGHWFVENRDNREQPRKVISTFVEDRSQYLSSTTVRTVSTAPIREMPDGCFVYSVILIDQDSMYTYSAVLDPEKTEVINFILEETIPRLENYQNKQ